jgi:hypothetical protein
MTAFGSFKVRGLKRRLKASIPFVYTTSHRLYNIRHFVAFTAALVQLKKPSGDPKGLIGPPCHGAPWLPEASRGNSRKISRNRAHLLKYRFLFFKILL